MSNQTPKMKLASKTRRHSRIRSTVKGTAECPRLFVNKSNRYTRAMLIDDTLGKTLVACSSVGLKPDAKEFAQVNLAEKVGMEIAKLAKAKNISKVVFDRGGNRYTGRVKAVAEGARQGGLIF